MEDDNGIQQLLDAMGLPPQRRLRSYREQAGEDSESATADASDLEQQGQQTLRRSARLRMEPTSTSASTVARADSGTQSDEQSGPMVDNPWQVVGSPSRGRGSRRARGGHRRGGSTSGATGPALRTEVGRRRGSSAMRTRPRGTMARNDSSMGWEEHEMDDAARFSAHGASNAGSSDQSWATNSFSSTLSRTSPQRTPAAGLFTAPYQDEDEDEEEVPDFESHLAFYSSRFGTRGRLSLDDSDLGPTRTRMGTTKRSREKFEMAEGRDALSILTSRDALSMLLYHSESPDPQANDVWPNLRSAAKLPAKYYLLVEDAGNSAKVQTGRNNLRRLREQLRPAKLLKRRGQSNDNGASGDDLPLLSAPGWPVGQLPTELFEEIADYLNRDDIKSMRLVCREFDRHISQVLFKTVVVPFNTEIYGMLNQEKPDLKGKKKVRVETKGLTWKNANGDDVYNGHGLDVFRGFGQHILKFGMSFEVNEDSLAKPPEKSMTERHTSFWGSYDWPFEEYRRFDDVAGLESAADETPRMTTAFSELSKVRELALSIDSGLGWLNGPDRSVRGRILQRPPAVFGTLKEIPDRRAQAQKELWAHIESCHRTAGSDVKLATLYKMEMSRTLTEIQDHLSLAKKQPEMPYLHPHLIHEAVPHDTADVQIPSSFEDPETLDRFVLTPSAPGTGILFTSSILPTDAGQLVSPIIPANLTKAQKEWLLETEWAQRAFLSSYMLSVIDNPRTFGLVHTLNISQLSDRYLSMLDRRDFWDSLPSLKKVVLLAIPGWRTVHKDEAGFVETPKISPSSGIDPFYDLLQNMISHRKNIEQLTFGWATGGEHAEGVHARNKLLLPSPLLPADKATEHDVTVLDNVLPQFPHVEELTLKNCWIPPPTLVQFVKQHDQHRLKSLILDSVSLTALLRNQNNGQQNHAQHVGGFVMAAGAAAAIVAAQGLQFPQAAVAGQQAQAQQNPLNPQQFLQFHIQALQMQIQQLQTQGAHGQPQLAQLQAQLQNQVQLQNQLQPMNLPQQQQQQQQQNQNQQQAHGVPGFQFLTMQAQQQILAAPPVIPATAPNPQAALKAQPREGSWMNVLDIISPGLNLTHFNSEFSQADVERKTSLERIQFVSCGYARLPYAQFDQAAIEPHHTIPRNPLFTRKYNALAPAMLSAKWPLLGEIIQEVDVHELTALNAGWDLVTGWKDSEDMQGPEFDGLLPGGTGRLTGVVAKQGFSVSDEEE